MTSTNVLLPETLLDQVRSAALDEQRTVEDLLAEAVQHYLEDRSWTKLLNDAQENARSLGIKESDVDRLIQEHRPVKRRS
jgi:hypothetical protein